MRISRIERPRKGVVMEKNAEEMPHDIRLTAAEVVALRDFAGRCLANDGATWIDATDRTLLANLLLSLDLQKEPASGARLVGWPSVADARRAVADAGTEG